MYCLYVTDVFSYDEDDMVEDPYLAKHLAHFGINITAMQKVIEYLSHVLAVSLTIYQVMLELYTTPLRPRLVQIIAFIKPLLFEER